jgi:tape measure domain-containing protein
MSETINYRLGLDNSDYTGGMRAAQRETRELSTAARNSNLGTISGELQMASGSLSTFTGSATKANGGLLELWGNMRAGVGATAGLTAGFVGVTTAVGAFVAVTKASQTVLSNYAPYDSMLRGLKTLEGTAENTTRRVEELRQVAKTPGLGFEEAVQADIRLRAVGFSAADSERSLKAFGNALATVGGGKAELDGVILGLTQIAAKGKISAEEINQIASRVPQVRQAMKDAFGSSDTEILQKNGIDATAFVRGLVEELEKLPQVTGGARNTLDNYSDGWKELKVEATEFAVGISSTWLNSVADGFDGATRLLKDFKAALGIKPAALAGADGETEEERMAKKAAEAKAEAEAAAEAEAVRAHNANIEFWTAKEAERVAAAERNAATRVAQEQAALDQIRAAGEKAAAAKLTAEENLERQIAALKAEGPVGKEAFEGTQDVLVKAKIAERTAAILTLQKQLATLQNSAADKARAEAESAERKAAAEEKALAARKAAAITFEQENAILEARAAGNERLVRQLERQAEVEATKQRLMNDQGMDERLAAKAAERRQELSEAAAKRAENPNRIRVLGAEDSAARRAERMSAADKARAARMAGVDAAAAAAAKVVEEPAAKDHTADVSRKLDRLRDITDRLDNLQTA